MESTLAEVETSWQELQSGRFSCLVNEANPEGAVLESTESGDMDGSDGVYGQVVIPAISRLRRLARRLVVAGADAAGAGYLISSHDKVRDICRLGARSTAMGEAPLPNPVLFSNTRGVASHPPYVSALLARALYLRGVGGVALLCDGALPACETASIGDYASVHEFLRESRPRRCRECYGLAQLILGALGVPVIPLSRFLTERDYRDARLVSREWAESSIERLSQWTPEHPGLGQHIVSSLYRFFLVGELKDNPEERLVAGKFASAAELLRRALERVMVSIEPRCVVAHHGIYLVGGLSSEAAHGAGIPFVAWDLSYRVNSVIFSQGDTYHRELRDEPVSAWVNREVSATERTELRNYLDSRRFGSLDYVSYNSAAIHDESAVRKSLGLVARRKTVVLFTNVAWDGRVHAADTLFSGPLEWVAGTARFLCEYHPNAQVIVRIHPAETNNPDWVSRQRADDYLRACLSPLPSNLIIIPPESTLSSYALAQIGDSVVVYSSKIGLEVLAMGKPVVIAGDALYSNKGIGVQPQTRDDYFAILERIFHLKDADLDMLKLIEKYAYHFFFRRSLQLPYPCVDHRSSVPPLHRLQDLSEGRYPSIDCLCAGLTSGLPFCLP